MSNVKCKCFFVFNVMFKYIDLMFIVRLPPGRDLHPVPPGEPAEGARQTRAVLRGQQHLRQDHARRLVHPLPARQEHRPHHIQRVPEWPPQENGH